MVIKKNSETFNNFSKFLKKFSKFLELSRKCTRNYPSQFPSVIKKTDDCLSKRATGWLSGLSGLSETGLSGLSETGLSGLYPDNPSYPGYPRELQAGYPGLDAGELALLLLLAEQHLPVSLQLVGRGNLRPRGSLQLQHPPEEGCGC